MIALPRLPSLARTHPMTYYDAHHIILHTPLSALTMSQPASRRGSVVAAQGDLAKVAAKKELDDVKEKAS